MAVGLPVPDTNSKALECCLTEVLAQARRLLHKAAAKPMCVQVPTLEPLLSHNGRFLADLHYAIQGVPANVPIPASPTLPPGAITKCVTAALTVFNPEAQQPFDLPEAATCIYRCGRLSILTCKSGARNVQRQHKQCRPVQVDENPFLCCLLWYNVQACPLRRDC